MGLGDKMTFGRDTILQAAHEYFGLKVDFKDGNGFRDATISLYTCDMRKMGHLNADSKR